MRRGLCPMECALPRNRHSLRQDPAVPGPARDDGPDVHHDSILHDVVDVVEVDRRGRIAGDHLGRVAELEPAPLVDVEEGVLLGEVPGLVERGTPPAWAAQVDAYGLAADVEYDRVAVRLTTVPSTVSACSKPGTRPAWKLSMKT